MHGSIRALLMRICATSALLLFRMKIVIDLKRLMNEYMKKDVCEHGSLLAPDIRNGLLQFELPLNESQTNTFKDPLSSVNALHTSQTDTSQSIPIKN